MEEDFILCSRMYVSFGTLIRLRPIAVRVRFFDGDFPPTNVAGLRRIFKGRRDGIVGGTAGWRDAECS